MKKRHAILFIVPLVLFVLGVIFVMVRFQMAVTQVQRQEDQLFDSSVPNIGLTKKLSILPLFEGAAGPGLEAGKGVSYLIRTDTQTIMMDLGYNPEQANPDGLEKNMRALGVSLDQISLLVISHAHSDHIGGKGLLGGETFYLSAGQPALGSLPIYTPVEMTYPGSQLMWVHGPMKLGEGVATTGPIPYINKAPASLVLPSGVEQSLVVNVEGVGLVVISGCGHPGMQRTVDLAQTTFGQPVVGVIGGQHYTSKEARDLGPEIAFLQALKPVVVSLSPHDSGPLALEAFREAFKENYKEIVVGQEIVVQ